ncbi:MAG TPA: hypothetical protein PKJ12_00185 [Ottowia sp.]|jgi:hypothetical protein|nr:hypothetical protein [Ottowia sp.]
MVADRQFLVRVLFRALLRRLDHIALWSNAMRNNGMGFNLAL